MAWIMDPKEKEKSVTLTFFTYGCVIAFLKLLLSGVEIGSFKVSPFSGLDFAAVIASLGGVYSYRRSKYSIYKKGEKNGKDKIADGQ